MGLAEVQGVVFYNRSLELDTVREVIDSRRAELFIVYGRRGVGKSALLSHALVSSRHIFYRATRHTLPLQLEGLTAMVREAYPAEFIPAPFPSSEAFLAFLAHAARTRPDEPVVAVIDELPYLAQVDQGFLTVLQHWWDEHKTLSNIKLLLAGSYVAFMEREVLDANAPLYNRRTGALRLDPLRYYEAALFFPSYSPRELIETYAILGGMPSYLEKFDPAEGWEQNLLATALKRSTYLRDEPDWLLLQDLRNDITYGSILHAIAMGNRKPSDIARAIGKRSAQDVTLPLRTLMDLQLVRREVPITDWNHPTSRNSQYWLVDNYLSFWYRYVDPGSSLIAQGRGERLLEGIKQTFHEYVARPPFEEVCRQFLLRAYASDQLPPGLELSRVGTWWDGSHEIDVVAQEGSRTTLVGSCKWTASAVGRSELNALQQALAAGASRLNPADDCWYALFSREGFDPRLAAFASHPDSHLLLFTPNDLLAL